MGHEMKMHGKSFFGYFLRRVLPGAAVICGCSLCLGPFIHASLAEGPAEKDDLCIILRRIYQEVGELRRSGEVDFLKREFFMSLDGNSDNREEHVVVFSHNAGDKEKMIVQVTYFESKRKSSVVKSAKETKKILCGVKGGRVEIEESDYDGKEIRPLLEEILKGIRNKKKLLRLLRENRSREEEKSH